MLQTITGRSCVGISGERGLKFFRAILRKRARKVDIAPAM